jgi:thymidylate synthase
MNKILSKEEFLEKLKTDREFNDEFGNKGIDQISDLIKQLKENPDSRRLLVSVWNISDLPHQVLPPCHYGFQVYTRELSLDERAKLHPTPDMFYDINGTFSIQDSIEDSNLPTEDRVWLHSKFDEGGIPKRTISLMWNQRSVDTGLGWSFNIASYSLLLIMLAKQVNMIPDEIICNLGDVHLYSNHIEPIKEQLGREPFPLPNVILSDRIVNNISEYTLEDIKLENYQYHPSIKLPLSN